MTKFFFLFPLLLAAALWPQTYTDDSLAVRALLDTNGLDSISVDSVADSSRGRITTLRLAAGGSRQNIPLPLTVLPASLAGLDQLDTLDLSHNEISELPAAVTSLAPARAAMSLLALPARCSKNVSKDAFTA